jgi:hypothetical protein
MPTSDDASAHVDRACSAVKERKPETDDLVEAPMTDDDGQARSADETPVAEDREANGRQQPPDGSTEPDGPSAPGSGLSRRLRGRGSEPGDPGESSASTKAVVPSKLAEATIVPFDKTFGVIVDVDLGSPSPDPIEQLPPEEREELREDLEEVVRAQRQGELLSASRRR